MLELKNIKKSFGGTEVLKNVGLSVAKGDVVAILGPSGSGKTTLLRIANFLETADGGEMNFEGEVLDLPKVSHRDAARIRRKTGFVFQNYNLFRNLTALENVTEGLRVVHLGDLGHELSGEQLAPLRGCDTLLIPVGGFYTIDAETAKRVADAIAPRVIVPMHYRHGSHGYDVIATVEDFLRLYPADEVHCLDGSSFELTPDAPRGVIVPKFMG